MIFDETQPIEFYIEQATLALAPQWQKLIAQLMTESNACYVAGVRDGENEAQLVDDGPAVTLLMMAEQGTQSQPVGMGSIENGELGIAVLHEYSGLGLGQLMVGSLLDWARENDVHYIWLDVQIDNAAAIHIYEKLHFNKAGRQQSFVMPDGQQVILQRMELKL
mgnify:CR=1 FL=1